jgi:hypothetical protein
MGREVSVARAGRIDARQSCRRRRRGRACLFP